MATTKTNHGQIVANLQGAEAALEANLQPSDTLPWEGITFTVTEVEGQIEGFVSIYDANTSAKEAASQATAKWSAALPEVKALWENYVAWVKLTQGKDPATLKKWNVPVKPPKAKPTVEQAAVSKAKRSATRAKAKALAIALAPKQPTVVAYDAEGNVIGAPTPPAVAPTPLAAAPSTK